MGGQLVEVFKDRALGLPPLNTTLARRMMEQTKIYHGARAASAAAQPVDLAALEQLLVRFSQLVVEQRWIKEIDINPLLASPERLIALDARVVLHDPDVRASDLPRLAIRPYPRKYVAPWTATDGTEVLHPADPARGRAAGGASSTRRSPTETVYSALLPACSASPSGPPTSG